MTSCEFLGDCSRPPRACLHMSPTWYPAMIKRPKHRHIYTTCLQRAHPLLALTVGQTQSYSEISGGLSVKNWPSGLEAR